MESPKMVAASKRGRGGGQSEGTRTPREEEERMGVSEIIMDVKACIPVQSGRGSWKDTAFHLATTTATPAAYAPLPFALASLGWPLGVFSLVGATLTTWYSSLLVASLWGWNGEKQTTYRHFAKSIFGSWGYWFVTIFQQVASLGNNVAIQIAAGSSLKAIYKYYHPDGTFRLQMFIVFFGAFEIILSQLPDIHSLRWVSAVSTISTIGFAVTTIGVTIYNGNKIDRNSIDYSLHGSSASQIFKALNALGVISFSFGNAMLPEIQSTVKEPIKKNMSKGISAAYGVIILVYWQLAFSGYWAFGSSVKPYILSSLTVLQWAIVMANVFATIQITGCFQIHSRTAYAYFKGRMSANETKSSQWIREIFWRFAYTSAYVALITFVAAAIPFFGDFVSICGAIGFIPLDIIFPVLAFQRTGRMPDDPGLCLAMKILNIGIATLFSVIAVLCCIVSIRFIVIDIGTYKFFYDM